MPSLPWHTVGLCPPVPPQPEQRPRLFRVSRIYLPGRRRAAGARSARRSGRWFSPRAARAGRRAGTRCRRRSLPTTAGAPRRAAAGPPTARGTRCSAGSSAPGPAPAAGGWWRRRARRDLRGQAASAARTSPRAAAPPPVPPRRAPIPAVSPPAPAPPLRPRPHLPAAASRPRLPPGNRRGGGGLQLPSRPAHAGHSGDTDYVSLGAAWRRCWGSRFRRGGAGRRGRLGGSRCSRCVPGCHVGPGEAAASGPPPASAPVARRRQPVRVQDAHGVGGGRAGADAEIAEPGELGGRGYNGAEAPEGGGLVLGVWRDGWSLLGGSTRREGTLFQNLDGGNGHYWGIWTEGISSWGMWAEGMVISGGSEQREWSFLGGLEGGLVLLPSAPGE